MTLREMWLYIIMGVILGLEMIWLMGCSVTTIDYVTVEVEEVTLITVVETQ